MQRLAIASLMVAVACLVTLLPTRVKALITVGAIEGRDRTNDVEIVGGIAYVAEDFAGLRIVDVSNPRAPAELGALVTAARANGV